MMEEAAPFFLLGVLAAAVGGDVVANRSVLLFPKIYLIEFLSNEMSISMDPITTVDPIDSRQQTL